MRWHSPDEAEAEEAAFVSWTYLNESLKGLELKDLNHSLIYALD